MNKNKISYTFTPISCKLTILDVVRPLFTFLCFQLNLVHGSTTLLYIFIATLYKGISYYQRSPIQRLK